MEPLGLKWVKYGIFGVEVGQLWNIWGSSGQKKKPLGLKWPKYGTFGVGVGQVWNHWVKVGLHGHHHHTYQDHIIICILISNSSLISVGCTLVHMIDDHGSQAPMSEPGCGLPGQILGKIGLQDAPASCMGWE